MSPALAAGNRNATFERAGDLTPSVIWTGQGYLAATTRFQGPNWPSELDKYSVEVFSLAADAACAKSWRSPGRDLSATLVGGGVSR